MRIPHSTAIIHRSMMAYPICSSEQSLVRKRIRGSKKVDDSPPGYFQRHSFRVSCAEEPSLRPMQNIRRGKNRAASCRNLRHEAARFFMPYLEAQKSGERKTPAPLGCKRSSAAFRLHPAGCPAARHSVKGKGAAFLSEADGFPALRGYFFPVSEKAAEQGRQKPAFPPFVHRKRGRRKGRRSGRPWQEGRYSSRGKELRPNLPGRKRCIRHGLFRILHRETYRTAGRFLVSLRLLHQLCKNRPMHDPVSSCSYRRFTSGLPMHERRNRSPVLFPAAREASCPGKRCFACRSHREKSLTKHFSAMVGVLFAGVSCQNRFFSHSCRMSRFSSPARIVSFVPGTAAGQPLFRNAKDGLNLFGNSGRNGVKKKPPAS